MDMRLADARREALQIFGNESGALDTADEKTVREALIKLRLEASLNGRFPREDVAASQAALLKVMGNNSIPKFDGDCGRVNVKVWFRAIEDEAQGKNWTEQQKAKLAVSLLEGRAKDWYLNHCSREPNTIVGSHYPTLKTLMLQRFHEEMSAVEKANQLQNLNFRADKHRNHINFLIEVEKTVHRVLDEGTGPTDWGQMVPKSHTFDKVLQLFFLKGCAPTIRQKIAEANCSTIKEMESAIKHYEASLRSRDSHPKHPLFPGYSISAIERKQDPEAEACYQQYLRDLHLYEEPPQVAAVHRGAGGGGASREVLCHYCGRSGHFRRNCPEYHDDVKSGSVHEDRTGPFEGRVASTEVASPPRKTTKTPVAPTRNGGKANKPGTGRKRTVVKRYRVNAVGCPEGKYVEEVVVSEDESEGENEEPEEESQAPPAAAATPGAQPQQYAPYPMWAPVMNPPPGLTWASPGGVGTSVPPQAAAPAQASAAIETVGMEPTSLYDMLS